jgi:hypothetical protein
MNEPTEIPIQKSFRRKGFDFKQVKRAGDIAIYEKRHPNHSMPSWEVVVIQHCPDRDFGHGTITPAHEHMPGDELWGKDGWTCMTEREANRVFDFWVSAGKVAGRYLPPLREGQS